MTARPEHWAALRPLRPGLLSRVVKERETFVCLYSLVDSRASLTEPAKR